MKPTHFEEENRILTLESGGMEYSANVRSVEILPIWTDDEQCISCWRPSFLERLSILFFGRIWIAVLSGGTQPPIYAQASRVYFEPIEEDLPEW